MNIFKRFFGKQDVGQPTASSTYEHPFRWYFLSVGYAMGSGIFRAITDDNDFMTIGGGSGLAKAKYRVRWYFIDSETPQSEHLSCNFSGSILSEGEEPKPLGSIRQAYDALAGGVGTAAVIAVLADARFDDFYSRYRSHLNQQYIQSGGLPIVTLICTDSGDMASKLLDCLDLQDEGKPFLAPGGNMDFFKPI